MIYMNYDFFKNLCLDLADKIKEKYDPDEIVSVNRGGNSASHIIAKRLKLDLGFIFPKSKELFLNNKNSKKIVIIEDLVAEGRTYNLIEEILFKSNYEWNFVPILVDGKCKLDFNLYGLKTYSWVVFPYEEIEKMVEGDRGLFRNRTDVYKG